ncbi:MAG: anaerobic ribonucleoside-triphosphate reductase activating protein [Bacteroidaceae bacterium]|jgi:anaerobic ribonucleoside-triphosphate reductase activating protein|nr:anaerobic ribonucleoside-triphosphate reductase activating protein [Bacteroidaceae bacterium]
MATISILEIVEDTTVDGPGFRTSVYSSGCPHHCPGCHNPQSWNIDNGHPVEIEEILKVILDDPFADVTFSGGDPMFQPHGFTELAKAIKQQSNKNIWCYTGFLFEELLKHPAQKALLEQIDVLVDGRFIEALKDEGLRFRGSSNQRIIDVKASLEKEETVVMDI